MWNDGVVHGEYGSVLWIQWCWMVRRHIFRHGGVMRNDGWNAMWDVWCGLYCVLWDSAACNLHFNVAICMAWCEVECKRDVEWCAEMWWSGLMRVMVRCGMLQFYTWWNATGMQNVMWNMAWGGMLHNARCGKLRYDVTYGGVSGIVVIECGICNMLRLLCDVTYGKRCNVLRCQMWWCNVEYGVMWNVLWRWMWVWCRIVVDVVVCNSGGRQTTV